MHLSDSQIAYPPQDQPAPSNNGHGDIGCTVHLTSVEHRSKHTLEELVRAAHEAWRRLSSGHAWADWLLIGEALMAGRTEAMHTAHVNAPVGRRYNQEYGHWLKTTGFEKIEATTRKRLLTCIENRDKIEKWRAALPTNKIVELNHPAVVLRHWQKTLPKQSDDNAKPKPSRIEKLEATIIELEDQNHRLQQNAPFRPQDKPKDIAGFIWRTIAQTPALARSIARALEKLAKAAEDADRRGEAA